MFDDKLFAMHELQGQLLRAVRIRVDVGLHTGRMSFDEAIDYFTEHVLFTPGARVRAASDPAARAAFDSATRAIYRYSKWPTQAITYNLGKNAIIELREACRAKSGSAFSARTFHERFMKEGSIPVAYIRDGFVDGRYSHESYVNRKPEIDKPRTYLCPTSRSTYFAITSTSRFTPSPGFRCDRFVTSQVLGMMAISK
jgi:hypothetical protein